MRVERSEGGEDMLEEVDGHEVVREEEMVKIVEFVREEVEESSDGRRMIHDAGMHVFVWF